MISEDEGPRSIGDIVGQPRHPPPRESTRWTIRPMTDDEARASYATVYNGLTIDFDLKGGNEVALTAEMDSRSQIEGASGWCTLSQSSFAKLLGVSVPTIAKALKNLAAKGVIERRSQLTEAGTVQWRLTPEARARREHYRRDFARRREEKLKRGR